MRLPSEGRWKAAVHLALYVLNVLPGLHVEHLLWVARPHRADALSPSAPVTPGAPIVVLEQGIVFSQEDRPPALTI